jgi:hypothetical protein
LEHPEGTELFSLPQNHFESNSYSHQFEHTEQRNLTGFRSISPKGHFFTQKEKRQHSKRSLNYEKRLRDHKQIINENQQMLKRLQGKQSTFDVVKWHREEIDRQRLLNNLKKNVGEEKAHKDKMEATLMMLPSQFGKPSIGAASAFNSTHRGGGMTSARRYYAGSTLMSKTAHQNVFQKKTSSFHASRVPDQVDQYSNETYPYQNNVAAGVELNSQIGPEDPSPDFANELN